MSARVREQREVGVPVLRWLGFAVVGVSAVACVGGTEDGAEPEAASEAAEAALSGISLRAFSEPLPIPQVVMAPKDGAAELTIRMCEFRSNVLPSTFKPSAGNYQGTWTWGYVANGPCPDKAGPARPTYLGPVVVARRGTPTRVRYVNELGTTATSQVMAYKTSTDQTVHWADPLGHGANMCAHHAMMNEAPTPACASHYDGPIPAVVHLHGGEVPPQVDGAPEGWFTADGRHGSGYYSRAGAKPNEAIYTYPNTQEASPAWFHDHTLGATRLNVYAGLAGAYVITDPAAPPPGSLADPSGIVPLIVQDRMFDKDGQLKMPNVGDNPEHPFWVPEFVGDVAVVNGKAMPYMEVEPRRYRFLVINGSNARTYDMALVNPTTGSKPLPIWQIGTDGGYLDKPVKIDPNAKSGLRRLSLMPGERADIVIDFAGVPAGTTLVLNNNAAPPGGGTPDMPRLMQFRVKCGTSGCAPKDTSFDPATGSPLRASHPIVRLTDPAAGVPAPSITIDKTRMLTLKEIMGANGPSEVLVNNTKFDGMSDRTYNDFRNITVNGASLGYSEIPKEGQTELWEIANLTEDPHPIHLHLVQFQVMNRQAFDVGAYGTVYEKSFPGGVLIPGFGPPLDYRQAKNPLSGGKDGGNPDVAPYLVGRPTLPNANEGGWKDTIRVNPGEVTRILVRWAPTDKCLGAEDLWYPFSPNRGGRGYMWHCHIIDHEDNEMMRPLFVVPNANAPTARPFTNY